MINVTVSWKDCAQAAPLGIDYIEIVVKSNAPGQQGVARPDVSKKFNSPPAILDNSSWATTVSGLTTGDKVSKVEVWVFPKTNGGLQPSIANGNKVPNNLIVP